MKQLSTKSRIIDSIKRFKTVFFDFLDNFEYFLLFEKYSFTRESSMTTVQLRMQLRRHIHAFEVSQTYRQGKHDRALTTVLNINKLVKLSEDLLPASDPIIDEAINCIHLFLKKTTIDSAQLQKINLLHEINLRKSNTNSEPVDVTVLHGIPSSYNSEVYQNLVTSRRSVRSFSSSATNLNFKIVQESVQQAIYSPSACNRQPWKVYYLKSDKAKQACLKIQNNSGSSWRNTASLLLVLVDIQCYGGSREKHAPYIDGGLFSMTLIHSLHSKGVDTCPLNLNLKTKQIKLLQKNLGLPPNLAPIMLIAFGLRESDSALAIPKGQRTNFQELLHEI